MATRGAVAQPVPHLLWPQARAFCLIPALATVVALAFALHSAFGIIWPDEIYQTVEPAQRVVHGYGFTSWELHDGLRSWLGPAAFMPAVEIAKLLGITTGLGVQTVVKVFLICGAAVTAYATTRLTQAFERPGATLVAAAAVATSPLLLVYDLHSFAEVVVLPMVVGAFAWVRSDRPRAALLAGITIGLAAAIRVQVLVMVVVIAVQLWHAERGDRSRRRLRGFLVGLSGPVVVAGFLDWATWGYPFASYYRYLSFNLTSAASREYGTEPAGFYLDHFWRTAGPVVAVVLLGGFIVGARIARWEACAAVLYVLAHALVPHKELRFLLPAVPLVIVVAAVGCAEVGRIASRRWPAVRAVPDGAAAGRGFPEPTLGAARFAVLLVVVGVAGLVGAHDVRTMDTGSLTGGIASSSSSEWGAEQSTNVLLSRAGARSDVCGVLLASEAPIWTGGFSYLQRDIGLYAPGDLSIPSDGTLPGQINAIIAPTTSAARAPFVAVTSDGPQTLYVRPGGCTAAPAGYTRTFPKQ
ncbi:MAG TPA: hypothetical protein VHE83_14425 [Mycobacteriales bacterium]|nr:hypothetical protein [Mycobacteriales bacterium]